MKRIFKKLAVVLSLILIVASLTACNNVVNEGKIYKYEDWNEGSHKATILKEYDTTFIQWKTDTSTTMDTFDKYMIFQGKVKSSLMTDNNKLLGISLVITTEEEVEDMTFSLIKINEDGKDEIYQQVTIDTEKNQAVVTFEFDKPIKEAIYKTKSAGYLFTIKVAKYIEYEDESTVPEKADRSEYLGKKYYTLPEQDVKTNWKLDEFNLVIDEI